MKNTSDEQQKCEEVNKSSQEYYRTQFEEKVGKLAKKYQCKKTYKENSLYDEIHDLLDNFKKELERDLSGNTMFYQYKPCKYDEEAGANYMLNQLSAEKNYLNIPSKFDDMYDSCPIVDCGNANNNNTDVINACILSQQIANLPENKTLMKDNNHWDLLMQDMKKNADKCIKVASFCVSSSNIPLWYYYAGENSGVCFEYKLENILQSLGNDDFFIPVIYTDNFFKYNPFVISKDNNSQPEEDYKNIKATIIANSFVKHKDWEFEKEWRIIRIVKGDPESEDNKFIKIPIESIIVGSKMDDSYINVIEKMKARSEISVNKMIQTIGGLKRESDI